MVNCQCTYHCHWQLKHQLFRKWKKNDFSKNNFLLLQYCYFTVKVTFVQSFYLKKLKTPKKEIEPLLLQRFWRQNKNIIFFYCNRTLPKTCFYCLESGFFLELLLFSKYFVKLYWADYMMSKSLNKICPIVPEKCVVKICNIDSKNSMQKNTKKQKKPKMSKQNKKQQSARVQY